jgi:hypothetical protein
LAKRRQIVLSRRKSGDAELEAIGKVDEVLAMLAPFNTAPDGGAPGLGALTLYGPGLTMTMPTTQPQITQLIANMTDEEIALPVLMRLCRALGWSMTDMETGRTFG